MGIRFRCHHCEHELHLKEFQAGRRGRCPACSGKFRIPSQSTTFSLSVDDNEAVASGSAIDQAKRSDTFNLKPSSQDPQWAGTPATERRSSTRASETTTPGERTVVEHLSSQSTNTSVATVPAAVAEAPHAVWYVRPPSGGQYGPADAHAFLSWLQDNRVSADSLVWRDGWPQWMVAGEALEDHFGSQWPAGQPVDNAMAQAGGPGSGPAPSGNGALRAAGTRAGEAPTGLLSPGPAVDEVDAPHPIKVRRQKQQINYAIFIGVLAILAIGLAVVLARVLLK